MAQAVTAKLLPLAKARFYVNIARVNALTEHALSLPLDVKDDDPQRQAMLVADLLRAVTIFLHVSFEDLLRTLQGKSGKGWTFCGKADLERALRRMSVDAGEFRDLFHCLQSLARARIMIVHYADLAAPDAKPTAHRGVVELWLHGYRVLGVAAFFYRIMNGLGPTTMVEDRARANADRAFAENLRIGRAMLDLARQPPGDRMGQWQEIADRLDGLLDVLKLTPEMFLDDQGRPLPGAVESLPLL